MIKIDNLKVKIFADGADLDSFTKLNSINYVKGFTTNPSLMKKSGIENYKSFAINLLEKIKDKPISFEVFADDLLNMERQANEIASWGKNIYVKIPITNTKGESTQYLVEKLNKQNIACNVTAVFTLDQVKKIIDLVDNKTPLILSVFAGRIADTGRDPIPLMKNFINLVKPKDNIEILWASTREVINIFQAEEINCHIITVPGDLLGKLNNLNKDLENFSKETVLDFYNDAKSAGYNI
jgi:transaldolase